jgi:hypothetical protein
MSFTCIGEALEQTHPEPFAVQYYQHHYLPNPANPDFAIGDAITNEIAINRLRSKGKDICLQSGYRAITEIDSLCESDGDPDQANSVSCVGQFDCL